MEERWVVVRKGADFQGISQKFGISPIIARLIRNRDVVGDDAIEQYLHGTLDKLQDGMLMKDMSLAIDIMREKIQGKKRIRIIGDYDIDGVNATYILLEGLERLGAIVDSDIPDRIKDGYGLNIELIERAIADDIDTIITCDNGIAAKAEIQYAKQNGMTIIVTDHHEVPYEDIFMGDCLERQYILPNADAIIDPKQEGCIYPFKHLCGAAVAYKLMEALYESLGKDSEDIDYLIENVAIATIGDVMDLVGENRIMVKQGLAMLRRTKNLGLQSLIEKNNIDADHLSSYHIGFVLGPCLNACGRLDTARRALELLRVNDKRKADVLAGELKALNDSRKELTIAGVEQAVELVEQKYMGDKVLVVYLADCHESLAGIIAGRIRERYHKPAFILTRGEHGVKGSGRSIEAYDMYEEMTKCKEIFTKYGGHKLAAGLSLCEERVEEFRKTINAMCRLTAEELQLKVSLDMQMPFGYANEQLVEELALLEPFGKGNTKPSFVEKDIRIQKMQILGANKTTIKLRVSDMTGCEIEALYFGGVDKFENYIIEKYGVTQLEKAKQGSRNDIVLALTFYPSINEYRGRKTVQVFIQNFR